jgi:uncharacterized protein (TIGR00255 family)
MSVRSMTGYARVRKTLARSEVVASVKSVNHRGLDPHFRMPSELEPLEPTLRAAIKRHVARGHLQVQIQFSKTLDLAPAVVNRGLLEAYLTAFRRAAAVHGLHGVPDLNAALRIPGMFEPADVEPDPELEAGVVEAVEEALELLVEFRETEGTEIAADLRMRNSLIREFVQQM